LLVCERQFSRKEESGGFLLKNFGGYAIKKEEKRRSSLWL
jgi:hypothetical protein